MELYVDIKFLNNSGDGTKEKPFGTISEAAAIAKPGDTVLFENDLPDNYSE
jgi:hypothetical protein